MPTPNKTNSSIYVIIISIFHVLDNLYFIVNEWCWMSESNGLPDAYRAPALPSELIQRKFGCGVQELHLGSSAYETDEILLL